MSKSLAAMAAFFAAISFSMLGVIYVELWSIPVPEDGFRSGRHIFPPAIAIAAAMASGWFLGEIKDD